MTEAFNDSIFTYIHGTEDTICADGGDEWNQRVTLWSTLRGVPGYETASLSIYNGHVQACGSYELNRGEVEALRDALTALLEEPRS